MERKEPIGTPTNKLHRSTTERCQKATDSLCGGCSRCAKLMSGANPDPHKASMSLEIGENMAQQFTQGTMNHPEMSEIGSSRKGFWNTTNRMG